MLLFCEAGDGQRKAACAERTFDDVGIHIVQIPGRAWGLLCAGREGRYSLARRQAQSDLVVTCDSFIEIFQDAPRQLDGT